MATGDITGLRLHSYGDRAEIDVEGFSVGGTFKSGFSLSYGGTGNIPVVASPGLPFYSPYLMIQTPGYDGSGASVTRTRKIYLTAQQRKAYPNDAQWEEEVVSTTLTFRSFLSEFVYSGDTLTEVHLPGEFYKSGATPSTEKVITSSMPGGFVNSSTLAYPTPIANWTRPDKTRLSSYSVTVAAIAFSPLGGLSGRPVAAIKFTATNGTQTASVTVSTFTKTNPTPGTPSANAKAVGEYIGTIDLTGFTDNTVVTVSMEVFPWIGSTKYNNSAGAGVNQWSPPQTYLLDVAGTRGYPIAVVDSSIGTSGGVIGASDTGGNHTTCAATPFDTVNNAQIALSTWLNANHGRTNIAGSTIYIKSNTGLTGATATAPMNAGDCAVLVKPFPGSTPVIPTATTPVIRGRYVRLEGLTFSRSADGSFIDANNVAEITFHRCTLTDTRSGYQSNGWMANYFKTWMSECQVNKLAGPSNYALWRQCEITGAGQLSRWHLVLGTKSVRTLGDPDLDLFVGMGAGQSTQGSIAFNNEHHDVAKGCYEYPSTDGVIPSGAAVVQCLITRKTETVGGAGSGERLLRFAADGNTNETHDCVIAHNTVRGNNCNMFYQDTPQDRKPHYGHALHYNLLNTCAAKTDDFADDARCTGNWPVHFGVNRVGNRTCGGAFPVSFNGKYGMAGHGDPPDGTYLMPALVSDTSASNNGTAGSADDGNFHPNQTGTNVKHVVMEHAHVSWDLNGENRLWDSRGYYLDSPGCYRYQRDTYVPFVLSGSRLSAASWILEEDFEGTGTPAGWTNPSGTAGTNFNFDETTDKIEGTQSLKVIGPNTGTLRAASTPLMSLPVDGNTWMAYWQMKMTAVPTGGNGRIMEILRASDSLVTQTAQIVQTTNELKVGNGSGVSGTPQATYALSVGTVYHFWIKRMADGTLQAWINTSGTFPGGVGQFTGSASVNPGTAGYIRLGGARNIGIVFDHFRVSATDIGSNPA